MPAFAAGFVLWGAGSSLRSGTLQALVYEELAGADAASSYARYMGRSQALGTTAMMAATGLAGPVLGVGGYQAVGLASVVVCCAGCVGRPVLPGVTRRGPRSEQSRGPGSEDCPTARRVTPKSRAF